MFSQSLFALVALALVASPVHATNKKDDYVVIGGGISGCMVANRLATYGYGVTLLEQGIDEGQVLSDFPASVQMRYTDVSLLDAPFGLLFKTPRNQLLVNRIISFGLGWGLGGGSLVNGAITQRPFRTDYDKWVQNDPEMAGWGYDSMLNYHINMEANSQFNYAAPQLNLQSLPVGGFGPIPIKDEIDFDPNINSGYSEDPNNANLYASHMADLLSATLGIPHLGHAISYAENPIGVGYSQKVAVGGYRVTAAHALIHPLIDPSLAGITYNPLLTVLTGAVAMRFDIDAKDGELGEIHRLYYTYQGEELSIKAKDEYILALGAINSPKLLLLSGVGPRADLEALGIEVVIDEPGVGLGLQDHPVVPAVIESQSTTFPNMKVDAQNLGLDSQALWFGQQAGYMATTGTPMHAFWKSSPDKEYIDTQVLLFDGSPFLSYPINNVLIAPCVDVDSPSRGKVSLRSANHNHHAVVDYGFYFDPSVDAAVQADPSYLPRGSLVHIDCLLAVHSAVQQSTQGFYVYAPPLDNSLWDYMKAIRAGFVPDPTNLLGTVMGGIVRSMILPGYHPASTLQMGGSANPYAPVDPNMRFKSIYNLRVVDASTQPIVVSANPMLSVYAMAMKAADLMMKRQNNKPKLKEIDVFPMCNGWFVVSNGAGEDDNQKRDAAGTWFLTSTAVEDGEEPQPENAFDQGPFFVERPKTIWIKTPVGSESRALYLRFEKEEASEDGYEMEWDDDEFLGPFFQRINEDCVDGF